MEKAYLVRYNDCYGNGDNKTDEIIVKSKDDFNRWLKERNEEREEAGEIEENAEEFDLIELEIFK